MLVLDESALRGLASRPEIVAHFPELKKIHNLGRSCCRKNSNYDPMPEIRRAFSSLSTARAKKLKELTSADTILIRVAVNGDFREVRY